MKNSFEKIFCIKEKSSSLTTETIAGITTFMTMSYIVFVQPSIMSGTLFKNPTGMDFGALLTGTCLAAAFGSILMGILANFPVALAPGMGENFFFVLTVLPACSALYGTENGWKTALGIVFLSGILFAVLSFLNVRKLLLNAISSNLQKAIAGGIGLFIALLGLQNADIIFCDSHHYVLSFDLNQASVIIFIIGLVVSVSLRVFGFRGAILWGLFAGALIAILMREIKMPGFPIGMPDSVLPIFAKMDFASVFSKFLHFLPFLIVFTFMDVFDTLGTLVGVCTQAGIMKGNELPNSKKAFAADATATIFGAVCGHSTVTSYIESATGVEHGGRTGLTAIVTGLCFLLAMFFSPFICAVSACKAVTAPALVIVGAMMMKSVKDIQWDDYTEAIPSFLVFAGIPFTYSIADGLTLGFISYPLIKLFSGRANQTGWLTYLIATILVIYLIFVRAGIYE